MVKRGRALYHHTNRDRERGHLDSVQIFMLMGIAEENLSKKALWDRIMALGWPAGIERFNDHLYYLFNEGLVIEEEGIFRLTEKGMQEHEKYSSKWKWLADIVKRFLLPTTAALVTFFVDLFLATLKLAVGFLSGSVALIADGIDGSVDTVSAGIVYISARAKKELVGTIVIIAMMFVTGVSIFWESIQNVYAFASQLVLGLATALTILELIDHPFLVIIAEVIGLIFAFGLSYYQHFVGKQNGSLALISQSIDSKNHIYVSIAVVCGAICSIFGIAIVDSIIGVFIAVRILKDGLELSSEVYTSEVKGEELDIEKISGRKGYEKWADKFKLERFRDWILYTLSESDTDSVHKDSVIEALIEAYSLPLIPHFGIRLASGIDFKEEFQNLIEPLLDNDLVKEHEPEQYGITWKGRQFLTKEVKHRRHRYY